MFITALNLTLKRFRQRYTGDCLGDSLVTVCLLCTLTVHFTPFAKNYSSSVEYR